jgi:hypothetical protein
MVSEIFKIYIYNNILKTIARHFYCLQDTVDLLHDTYIRLHTQYPNGLMNSEKFNIQ